MAWTQTSSLRWMWDRECERNRGGEQARISITSGLPKITDVLNAHLTSLYRENGRKVVLKLRREVVVLWGSEKEVNMKLNAKGWRDKGCTILALWSKFTLWKKLTEIHCWDSSDYLCSNMSRSQLGMPQSMCQVLGHRQHFELRLPSDRYSFRTESLNDWDRCWATSMYSYCSKNYLDFKKTECGVHTLGMNMDHSWSLCRIGSFHLGQLKRYDSIFVKRLIQSAVKHAA